MAWTRADVVALDRADPLARYRDAFVIDDDDLVYLDGNSLGRLTKEGRRRVVEALDEEWGSRLIRSWDEVWLALPTRLGDLIGTALLGADAGEVVVGDSTTIALYKAIAAVLDHRPDRTAIVIEEDNFPTDRYVVESLAGQRGLEIRWIRESGADGISAADVAAVLDERVAATVLSHVDYRSAAIIDMAAITGLAHDAGALAIWDLCHAVGAIAIDLHGADVDLAVGCTYKYLNGGPGSPSFTYVRRALQDDLQQPIWGWFGRRDMFEMGAGYDREPGVRSWLTGTSAILSLVAIEPGVEMIAEAGLTQLRAKSERLTALAVDLFDERLAELGWSLESPRDPAKRGSHVTVSHPDARRAMTAAMSAGVIPDFRRPDGIRLGLAPLTTRYADVFDGVAALAAAT
jgi:kynureninase